MNNEKQWAWCSDENSHGPFDTREAAIRDAREYYGLEYGDVQIGLGIITKVTFINPIDVDDLMEMADEHLANGFCFDDPVFILANAPGQRNSKGDEQAFRVKAERDLSKAIEAWAAKYVELEIEWFLEPNEHIVLTADPSS